VIALVAGQAAPAYAGGSKVQTKMTSRTSVKLPKHGAFYLYGAVSDGSSSNSPLQDQLYSVQDADGFTSAAIAEGPTARNSDPTTTGHARAGIRTPTADNQIVLAGESSNAGPGSSLTTSVSFSVSEDNTIVEVIALGSGQQTSSLTGVTGLTMQESSNAEALQVADVLDPTPGPYTVTLDSSQTAPGQDPNHAADLLAVFEFERP